MSSLFREGENCWRTSTAEKAALVIDCAQYYDELYHLLQHAEKSIYILGWEFHSKTNLYGKRKDCHPPCNIGEYLTELARSKPHLHIYILIWNPNIVYSYPREMFARWKMQHLTPNNIHFFLDNERPMSSSHHQKMVIVDNTIAYCGGMDITAHRWDTHDHKPKNPFRILPNGKRYGPYHDVQIRLYGQPAADLGDWFRHRWYVATKKQLRKNPPELMPLSHYPQLPWDITDVPYAITRTLPMYGNQKEVMETKAMYVECIRAAKHHIFIENQYLTSKDITAELCARLREEDGPAVTIILPKENTQGLGNKLLTLHRNMMVWQLQQADIYERLGVFSPVASDGEMIYVHSKIMIVDDAYAIVGSSNLSARSMGLDTECDIAIDAGTSPEHAQVLADWKTRLIAEHLDCRPEDLADVHTNIPALHEHILGQYADGKTLWPIISKPPNKLERIIVESEVTDYQHPLLLDTTLDSLRKPLTRRRVGLLYNKLFRLSIVVGVVLLFATTYKYTPLMQYVNIFQSNGAAETLQMLSFAPYWLPLIFVVLGLIFTPINLLVLTTATIFDGVTALSFSIIGAVCSATTNYLLGRLIGSKGLERMFSKSTAKISATLQNRQLPSYIIIRFIPLAPFGIVNIIAGAYKARFVPFVVGTFLGILPGFTLLVFFQRSLLSALLHPSPLTILLLTGAVTFLGSITYYFRKRA